ncbi:ribosome silencing factor [Amphibacillus sp. MSJ-3]|uniref:ribosome silencing factor n=1 Tax=Amphibacillus sp. MSJ-3 TaxID=2841505 RepID=UPI001C0ECF83|nr:ribosome silencing factor [Amphibacillus sp. MSJ-3]MBU5595320.1 ribosome silencing factor [Amphibacillus sp. MSJ-3]
MNNEQLIKNVVKAADDKRAEDILVLDMKDVSVMADYFVICEGSSERQVQAIARGIKEAVEDNDAIVNRMEGFEQARWILIDLGDVVCHIFHQEERSYYNLERLWGDAPIIEVD